MLRTIIHKLLAHRHYWRHATFSEVAELYMARMLRIFASRMIAIFVAVYLYTLGYSLIFIALYMAAFFAISALAAAPALWYTKRFGPKHAILASNLLFIPAMIIFAYMPPAGIGYGLVIIAAIALLKGMSNTIYDYAHNVDFSKIKHADHAGKEIGFMVALEKVAGVAGPIVGGLIATFFGMPIALLLCAACFALAAAPLLRTAEPIRLKQNVKWRTFPWRTAKRGLFNATAPGMDVATVTVGWGLFMAVIVLPDAGNAIFANLGILIGIGTAASILAAIFFGKVIDKHQGRQLMQLGILGKSLSHALRPLVSTPVHAAGLNALNDTSYAAYIMAFTRGIYDDVDRSGHRLVYLFYLEVFKNSTATIACIVLALLLYGFDTYTAFSLFFIACATYQIIGGWPRLTLYK